MLNRNDKNRELFRNDTKLTTQALTETKGNEISNEDKDKNYEVQKKKNLVKNIKYNKFCFYLLFFCYTKRKKKENIFLEEGVNIIRRNLDIIKIFKEINKKEIIARNIKNKDSILNFSIHTKNL